VDVPAELVWLIERLRTTSSRRGRLRLLVEAWSTIRDLGPADRLLVARELGFEGADRLVEQIAQGHGGLRSILGTAVERLEQETGSGVGDLMRNLLDPTARREAVEHLVDAADAWAADVESSRERDLESDESAGPGVPERVEQAGVAVDLPRVEGLEPVTAAEPEGPADPAREPTPMPATTSTDGETAPDERKMARAARPSGSSGERASASPAPPAVPGETAPPDRGHEPIVDPAADGHDAGGQPSAADKLAAGLEAEPRITERLHRLRGEAAVLREAEVDELITVLGSFPPGWARRRAMQRLLEAGVPLHVADAVRLLGMLERPSERLWAITTIAATRCLDETDREMLLAAVESPAVRQRLARRFARR